MGVDLKSDDLAWKDLFPRFGRAKGVACFYGFFWKNEFFENQASLKRFIFVVSEYGNLTSVKTYRDRLRNLGNALLDRKFKFFDFGRDTTPKLLISGV